MLRITLADQEASRTTLRVEGEVVSDAVAVLLRECLKHLETTPQLRLDFSGVTLIDRLGAETLKRLQDHNVTLINCSPLIDEIIRDCAG